MDNAARAELEERTERWFVRRGLPHFIADYSPTRDIFTRASGFLTVVFLLELLNGINETFDWWENVLALIGAVGIALVGIAAVNKARGRRLFQRPNSIGALEIGAFIVIPGLIPAVVAGQPAQGLEVAIGNVVIVGLVFIVTSYGLVPMTRWATGRMLRQLRGISNLLVRSLPLLLLFTMFIFFNAEIWKITDDLPSSFLWSAIGVLVVVGSLFVLMRLPRELRLSGEFATWQDIAELTRGTPMAGTSIDGLVDPPSRPPLRRRAKVNVGLVLFFSQAIQILLVSMAIFLFYIVFGMFTVIDTTITQWTGSPSIEVLAQVPFAGHDLVLSAELVRTALFIAAVGGLQFTVAALTDTTYREEFYDGLSHEIREAMAVRDLYLARVVDEPVTSDGGDPRHAR